MALPRELTGLQPNLIPGVYLQKVAPEQPAAFTTGLPVFFGSGAPAADPALVAAAAPQPISGPFTIARFVELQLGLASWSPDAYLLAAVKGFFENGGHECRVVFIDPSRITTPAALVALWREAFEMLAPLEDADLACAPSLMNAAAVGVDLSSVVIPTQRALLEACEDRGDCFAILDSDPAGVIAQQQALYGWRGSRSSALYFPRIKVAGDDTWYPPCGHVAGTYHYTDETVGVHKAPANLDLTGIVDLSAVLTDAEHRALGQPSINVLRALPGRGIRAWGARTLAADETWTFINVRRLFISVQRWLERMTAWATFEPNDLRLWVRVSRQLNAYFNELFVRGGLKGHTADQAFFVKCDEETNPPAVRDRGMMVAQIGLAPLAPGEFIYVRLVQSVEGVNAAIAG